MNILENAGECVTIAISGNGSILGCDTRYDERRAINHKFTHRSPSLFHSLSLSLYSTLSLSLSSIFFPPPVLRCRFGFKGENCSDCATMPGCQRGSCDQPLDCNCHQGWKGLFCSIRELNHFNLFKFVISLLFKNFDPSNISPSLLQA